MRSDHRSDSRFRGAMGEASRLLRPNGRSLADRVSDFAASQPGATGTTTRSGNGSTYRPSGLPAITAASREELVSTTARLYTEIDRLSETMVSMRLAKRGPRFLPASVLLGALLLACGSSAIRVSSTGACDLSAVPTAPPTLPVVKGLPSPASSEDPARLIAKAAARNDAALAAYRASGCDPRSLKQIGVSHVDGPRPLTFEEAVARADTIVVGQVRSLDPLDVWSQGRLPVSTAHVDVAQTLKGTPRRTIDVKQFGGIALQPEGLGLGHLGAELILPGDEVVLLLEHRAGAFWAVYPVGAVRLRGSALEPTVAAPYQDLAAGIRTMRRAQLLARIRELAPAR